MLEWALTCIVYERLGYQWATALLGFLCLAMMPFPYVYDECEEVAADNCSYIFYRYGKRIRQRSKYASAQ